MTHKILALVAFVVAMQAVRHAAFSAEAPPPTSAPDSNLELVLGKAKASSYAERSRAIKGFGKSLSADDVQALYVFLDRKAGEDSSAPGELNALKNDVVNALKMQQVMPADLAGHLMAMFRDRSHDEVWRDYCVQHLGDIYEGIESQDVREQSRKVLWDAAEEKQGSIPGTVLIALGNLCGQKGFEQARIAAKALEMVKDPGYGEPAKITALQICAKLKERAVLPEARKLATGWAVPLRVSAIACLGILGDKSDLALLTTVESSTDIRLRTAGQAAIARIDARNTEP